METAFKKNGNMLSQIGRPVIGSLANYSAKLRSRIKAFRANNAGWGPISIRIELAEQYGYLPSDLPSDTSIYRYLKQEGFIKEKEPSHPMPTSSCPRARSCHQKWEMDAMGTLEVKGISNQSLIDIKDVFSKLYCMSFPVAVKNRNTQPAMIHYKWALRLAFTEVGRPKVIQVDKDSVFIDNNTKSPFPKKIHLWLLALGIEFCFIEHAPPVQNSMIERSHQTFFRQAIKGKNYATWKAFFKRLQQRRKRLNEKYPSRTLGRKAPLQCYPQAKHSGRLYSIEQESQLLDLKRVYTFLAKGKWYRLVGKSTKSVYLGGHVYYVKKVPKNRNITITFCNRSKKLLFHDVNELLLAKHPIKGITLEDLMGANTKKLIATYKRIFKANNFPF